MQTDLSILNNKNLNIIIIKYQKDNYKIINFTSPDGNEKSRINDISNSINLINPLKEK